MQLTWLDSNSWLMEIAGKTILLDPWLVGSLMFNNLDWLFKGIKPKSYSIKQPIDLILLSQGLEDHAHPPTLKELDHSIPVVGSPNAAKVVKALGYTQVTSLSHGESYTLDNAISIKAVPGSLVGPQLIENGYIITDLIDQNRLYYEPHGYHSPTLKEESPIDVVITPVVGFNLLYVIPFLQGQKSTLELCKLVKPQFVLPTATAVGDVQYEGILAKLITQEGTVESFRQLLADYHLSTQVLTPKPGEIIELSLAKGVLT
ncbi:conserved hypothetical protein [Rippkaea orientalis PCC 8801]|uniref:Zn-dependent hydrolase of the beta-lactamase fold-like protein n=1 Tax=Rippkaea orientalis (strain PCC 8801 / RF-1) TaxID=41431 RepID=B7K5J9_RIPO1|nr:MBL fold metallo-hydrolase [Rippkaea orientalis]ACK66732.1 conserved hypothetical protein [Rippkaea orientalis PCC 8801]